MSLSLVGQKSIRAQPRRSRGPTIRGGRGRGRTFRLAASVVAPLWLAYFSISAFYLFPSGVAQLADFLFLGISLIICLCGTLRPHLKTKAICQAVSAFAGYAIAVNLVWWLILGDDQVLMHGLYLFYNAIVVVTTATVCRLLGRRVVVWTLAGVLLGVSIQFGLAFTSNSSASRLTLFTNNPIQVAYYATLLCSIFWVLSKAVDWPSLLMTWISAGIYGMGAFLSVMAASRAGVIALGLLMFLQSLSRARYLCAGVVLLAALLYFGLETNATEHLADRFVSKSRSTLSEMEHRGYQRIWQYPEHLFFGAGEGAFKRFDRRELHSTLGTVLFSYGIVGLALFMRIFWTLGRRCGFASLVYLLPALAFGMTHNGLRHSELWILIVLTSFINYRVPAKNSHRVQRSLDKSPRALV